MIINLTQLNATQLQELESLQSACRQQDGGVPNLYAHILSKMRALPASLLYYQNGKLMGFLSAFFFYNDAVEIALLVHPKVRRQGIAKQLIATILPLLGLQDIKKTIFCTPAGLYKDWLPAKGYTYLHSEYFMVREDLNPIEVSQPKVTLRLAVEEDTPQLAYFDETCFPKKPGDTPSTFEHLFYDEDYQAFLAYYDNQVIGKAHLRWEKDEVVLSDIAITKALQGKGLGTALIARCINHALEKGKTRVSLDVETHNERALQLYSRLGFVVHNACDYWTIPIAAL